MIYFLLLLSCLIIVLVIFIVFLRKDNIISLESLRQKYEEKNSKYFDFNGLSCHYISKGSGETVVLIHGLGDSFKIFDTFAALLEKEYHVVLLDLPGFGLSDTPENFGKYQNPIAYYRSFIASFAKEAKLEKFHLMGNSLGGLIAWDTVANSNLQIQTLTLLASGGFEMDKVKKNITKGVVDKIPNAFLKRGVPKQMAGENAKIVLYKKVFRTTAFKETHYAMINSPGTLAFLITLIKSNSSPDVKDLKNISIPTLIVWGNKDNIIPFRHASLFEENIANAKVKIYEDCGHYPQVEYADKLMQDWLAFKC